MNQIVLRNLRDGNREWDGKHTNVTPIKDTLIIFDWDDTLLPTTWIIKEGFLMNYAKVLTPEETTLFDNVSISVLKLLQTAQELGHTIIITNSQSGWLEESIGRFMPRLIPILSTLDIRYARTMFEKDNVGLPDIWKRKMFEIEVDNMFGSDTSNIIRNVVSIGDGYSERLATASLRTKNTYAKNIKFYDIPGPNDTIKQVDFMIYSLKEIVMYMGNLDLILSYNIAS
jgi:hypothetical protein